MWPHKRFHADSEEQELPLLPLDIQALIFSQNSELLRLAQLLSRDVRKRTAEAYLKQFGHLPISKKEFDVYMATHPDKISTIHRYRSIHAPYTLMGQYFLKDKESTSRVNYIDYVARCDIEDLGQTFVLCYFGDRDVYIIDPVYTSDIDILSAYHIYRSRSCHQLDPTLAGRLVRDQFERFLVSHSKDASPGNYVYEDIRPGKYVSDDTRPRNCVFEDSPVWRLVNNYIYCRLTTIMLNLKPVFESRQLYVRANQIPILQHNLDCMIAEIRAVIKGW